MTIFAYVTVFAARIIGNEITAPIPALPDIPVNLLILMGLSVVTATASKDITISYLNQNLLPKEDKSTLSQNRNGETDLTKVQMII